MSAEHTRKTTCTRCGTWCCDYRQRGEERICICCVSVELEAVCDRQIHAVREAHAHDLRRRETLERLLEAAKDRIAQLESEDARRRELDARASVAASGVTIAELEEWLRRRPRPMARDRKVLAGIRWAETCLGLLRRGA